MKPRRCYSLTIHQMHEGSYCAHLAGNWPAKGWPTLIGGNTPERLVANLLKALLQEEEQPETTPISITWAPGTDDLRIACECARRGEQYSIDGLREWLCQCIAAASTEELIALSQSVATMRTMGH